MKSKDIAISALSQYSFFTHGLSFAPYYLNICNKTFPSFIESPLPRVTKLNKKPRLQVSRRQRMVVATYTREKIW